MSVEKKNPKKNKLTARLFSKKKYTKVEAF